MYTTIRRQIERRCQKWGWGWVLSHKITRYVRKREIRKKMLEIKFENAAKSRISWPTRIKKIDAGDAWWSPHQFYLALTFWNKFIVTQVEMHFHQQIFSILNFGHILPKHAKIWDHHTHPTPSPTSPTTPNPPPYPTLSTVAILEGLRYKNANFENCFWKL